MGKDVLQEYIEVLKKRYIQSTRAEKTVILSEFCATGEPLVNRQAVTSL